jgi:hypothetical protein
MRRRWFVIAVLATSCLTRPAAAQENPEGAVPPALDSAPEELAPDEFGTDVTIHNVAPNALVPRVADWADCQLTGVGFTYWQPTPSNVTCALGGSYELPAGALLIQAQVFYNDTSAALSPTLVFMRTSTLGVNTTLGSAAFPAGAPGNTSVFVNFPVGTTIDNLGYTYGMDLSLPPSTRFYRVRLRYQRQVSPAPAGATFTDVPVGSPQHRFVEALAAAGVTGGCGGGLYCPDNPVTRGQMAVFLSVALGLHFPN